MPFIDLNQNKNQNMLKNDDSGRSFDPIKRNDQDFAKQSDISSTTSNGVNFNVQNSVSNNGSDMSSDLKSPSNTSNLNQTQGTLNSMNSNSPSNVSNLHGGPEPIISNKNDKKSSLMGSLSNQDNQNTQARVSINQNITMTNQQNDINNEKSYSKSQVYPSLREVPMNPNSSDVGINSRNVQEETFKEVENNSRKINMSPSPSSIAYQDKSEVVSRSDNNSKSTASFYGEHGEKIVQGPEFEKTEIKKEYFTVQKTKEAVKLDSETPSIVKNPIEKNVIIPSKAVIDDYIKIAIEKNASDIHFVVNYPVFFRIDGKLQKFGTDPVKKVDVERLFVKIVPRKKWENLIKNNIEADFMFEHKSGNRFRINIYKERSSLAGAFRLIPKKVRTIEELDLPSILKEFSKIPYGLVLVTGPTGSGKSTTIAAIIEEINRTEPKHIITIEDPVEYIYKPSLALISQRNMFEDTRTWADALRAVLREDPDVVVIGEMRDYKTIASALTVAETGHLVFATLHTNNASQTIDRIIDVFPEGQQNQVRSQLSSMLAGVISQRLVPLKKGGRKAVVEILLSTIAVKNAIREGKTHQIRNIIQTSADLGMMTIEKSLVDLVRRGLIDIDTAKQFTSKPDEIDLLLK